MSIKAMTYVWSHSNSQGTARLTLLALADACNDDGEWSPGVSSLAKKVNLGERQTQRCLRELEKIGEIRILTNQGVKTGSGNTNRYQMVIYRQMNGFEAVTSMTPLDSVSGDIYDTPSSQAVTSMTPQAVTSMTPNTSVYPSVKRERAPHSENRNVASPAIEQKKPLPPLSPKSAYVNGASSMQPIKASATRGLDPRRLVNGRIPAGTGTTPIEVFYERHSFNERDTRLSAPLEDDILAKVKDLERWRAAVIAWQQAGLKPKNITGQLDWYRDGIPESYRKKAAPVASKTVVDVPDYIKRMQQGIGK